MPSSSRASSTLRAPWTCIVWSSIRRDLGHAGDQLVAHLADHFLQKLLQRDDAGRAAELVDCHGHLTARDLHFPEQVVDGFDSGMKRASRIRGSMGSSG